MSTSDELDDLRAEFRTRRLFRCCGPDYCGALDCARCRGEEEVRAYLAELDEESET